LPHAIIIVYNFVSISDGLPYAGSWLIVIFFTNRLDFVGKMGDIQTKTIFNGIYRIPSILGLKKEPEILILRA
jgi:hypothetical protein